MQYAALATDRAARVVGDPSILVTWRDKSIFKSDSSFHQHVVHHVIHNLCGVFHLKFWLADDAGWLEPGNLAADLYLDELDEGLAEDLRDRLAALDRAEQRLATGTYGLSVDSGNPIPDERLEAFPTAERTVEEERALSEGRGG